MMSSLGAIRLWRRKAGFEGVLLEARVVKEDQARGWFEKAVEWTEQNQPNNDELYQQIGPMFGLHPELNVWSGKCLVIVFAEHPELVTYLERRRQTTRPAPNARTTLSYEPDGRITIAFFTNNPTALINGVTRDTISGFTASRT